MENERLFAKHWAEDKMEYRNIGQGKVASLFSNCTKCLAPDKELFALQHAKHLKTRITFKWETFWKIFSMKI